MRYTVSSQIKRRAEFLHLMKNARLANQMKSGRPNNTQNDKWKRANAIYIISIYDTKGLLLLVKFIVKLKKEVIFQDVTSRILTKISLYAQYVGVVNLLILRKIRGLVSHLPHHIFFVLKTIDV